jgi:hypothetical protein
MTLMLFLFLPFLSVSSLTPPDPIVDVPLTGFSSNRALGHLKRISAEPHPIGSHAHAEVRDYLLGELAKMGLEPKVQRATAVNNGWGLPYRAATVENIVAKLEGVANSRAVLLVGHYDSAPHSFGASDDGAAVAAMLETLRALTAGPRLKNDVIFLFSDGEEVGLLGARAFVEKHPWAKDVGVAFNFEARGTHGPSIMFQTSSENGWLIGEFAKAVDRPVATSLSHDIYKLLPNDTDFTVLRDARMAGLNFAFIEDYASYHSSLDNAENIDARSLQHHGTQALALTRHFGDLDLRGQTSGADVVYFDLWGRVLLHYSRRTAIILACALTLLALAVIAVGLRRKFLTLSGLGLGASALLLSVISAGVLVKLAWWVIVVLHGARASLPQEDTHVNRLYAAGFIALTIASASTVYALLRRKLSVDDLAVGSLLWFWALMILSLAYMPGGSYLLTWPLMFGLAGWVYRFISGRRNLTPVGLCLIFLPAAASGIILFAPLVFQLFVAFGITLIHVVAALAALPLGLFVVQFDLLGGARRWLLPTAAATVGLGFILTAVASRPEVDRQHPQKSDIFYALNADTRQAIWASTDERPGEWTAQFLSGEAHKAPLSDYLPWMDTGEFLQHPAPVAPLPPPEIEVLEDSVENGMGSLRVRVSSRREAAILLVYVGSEIFDGTVNGEPFGDRAAPARDKGWLLTYWNPPPEGIDLTFKTASLEPLSMRVVDKSYQLPELEALAIKARPSYIIPAPFTYSDSTFISRSFTLPAPAPQPRRAAQ